MGPCTPWRLARAAAGHSPCFQPPSALATCTIAGNGPATAVPSIASETSPPFPAGLSSRSSVKASIFVVVTPTVCLAASEVGRMPSDGVLDQLGDEIGVRVLIAKVVRHPGEGFRGGESALLDDAVGELR